MVWIKLRGFEACVCALKAEGITKTNKKKNFLTGSSLH
jgi:hypothetical protein